MFGIHASYSVASGSLRGCNRLEAGSPSDRFGDVAHNIIAVLVLITQPTLARFLRSTRQGWPMRHATEEFFPHEKNHWHHRSATR